MDSTSGNHVGKSTRNTDGCLLCRIRHKDCVPPKSDPSKRPDHPCEECLRLRLYCPKGYSQPRPPWLAVKHPNVKTIMNEIRPWTTKRNRQRANQEPPDLESLLERMWWSYEQESVQQVTTPAVSPGQSAVPSEGNLTQIAEMVSLPSPLFSVPQIGNGEATNDSPRIAVEGFDSVGSNRSSTQAIDPGLEEQPLNLRYDVDLAHMWSMPLGMPTMRDPAGLPLTRHSPPQMPTPSPLNLPTTNGGGAASSDNASGEQVVLSMFCGPEAPYGVQGNRRTAQLRSDHLMLWRRSLYDSAPDRHIAQSHTFNLPPTAQSPAPPSRTPRPVREATNVSHPNLQIVQPFHGPPYHMHALNVAPRPNYSGILPPVTSPELNLQSRQTSPLFQRDAERRSPEMPTTVDPHMVIPSNNLHHQTRAGHPSRNHRPFITSTIPYPSLRYLLPVRESTGLYAEGQPGPGPSTQRSRERRECQQRDASSKKQKGHP